MKLLRIRHAREKDIPGVEKLQQHWQAEKCTWGFVPDTSEALQQQLGRYFLVAESAGKIIAYALGKVHDALPMAALDSGMPCFELLDLYVHPAHRSKGIGGLLVRSILRNVRKSDIHQVKLYSGNKDIPRVHAFYAKHGFATVGIEMIYREKK